MKSYERPRHALFNQKLNITLNQLSTQDILLLLSSMKPTDLNFVYIFVPQKRRWLSLKELPEFQVPFNFDRGMKSPPLNLGDKPAPQNISQPLSQSAPPGGKNPIPPSHLQQRPQQPPHQPPPAVPPRMQAPPPKSFNDELTDEIAIEVPAKVKPSQKTPTIDDDRTDEIVLADLKDAPPSRQPSAAPQTVPAPSKKPPEVTKNTNTNADKLKGLVGNDTHPSLNQKVAASDLENPFSSLKKAFNRERVSPGSTLPDKNPLKPLDSKAAQALKEGTTLPRNWTPFPGKPLTLEPIINIGFRSNVVKVAFPFVMMDRAFENPPGVTFAVKAVYLKQQFNLEVFLIKDVSDKNVLKINETLDFKYIRDLMHVLGIAV